MAKNRLPRINEEILRVLSGILRNIKDPRVAGHILSVTHVETTPDMRYAKVFVSLMASEEEKTSCIKGLKSAAGYLRRELSGSINLRYTPELIFELDDSITRASHIMNLIDKVSENEDNA